MLAMSMSGTTLRSLVSEVDQVTRFLLTSTVQIVADTHSITSGVELRTLKLDMRKQMSRGMFPRQHQCAELESLATSL